MTTPLIAARHDRHLAAQRETRGLNKYFFEIIITYKKKERFNIFKRISGCI